jgi:hypothetical protein
MSMDLCNTSNRSVSNVALAYFMNARHLHDAATDLCSAGFLPGAINITQSAPSGVLSFLKDRDRARRLDALDQHTWLWRTKRFLAHDVHRRGADQISGDDAVEQNFKNPTCAPMDFEAVLSAMSVSPIVAALLLRDLRDDRVFVLVDAEGRVEEACSILKINSGHMRTEYLKGLPA